VNDTSSTATTRPNFLRSPATWMAGAEVMGGRPEAAPASRVTGPLPWVFLAAFILLASPPGAGRRVG
jgi:hypothetical protein